MAQAPAEEARNAPSPALYVHCNLGWGVCSHARYAGLLRHHPLCHPNTHCRMNSCEGCWTCRVLLQQHELVTHNPGAHRFQPLGQAGARRARRQRRQHDDGSSMGRRSIVLLSPITPSIHTQRC